MSQLKLIEKILSDKENCEKIAAMTLEEFKEALAQRGLEIKDAERVYSTIRTSVAGGELDEEDLNAVTGGACGFCDCKGACD